MSNTIWVPRMDDRQLQTNVAYVTDCMKAALVGGVHGETWEITATIKNWRDYLLGRTFAPSEYQTWSDVAPQQPQAVEVCDFPNGDGTLCGMQRGGHLLWEAEHAGQPFLHEFQ